jgi:hypothetical protein
MTLPMATAVFVLPLAAADWLEALLPLLFFIFWIVSQVVNVVRRVRGGPPVGGPVVKEIRRQPPAAQGSGPGDARADIERQIEAFRRAQQEAASRPPASAPASASRPRTPPALPQPKSPSKDGGRKARSAAPPPPPQPRPRGGAIGGHAGEIGRHVDEAFSHDLAHAPSAAPQTPLAARAATRGTGEPLSRRTEQAETTAAAPHPTTAAEELVAILRNPATVRQVVLLREVLDRPVERW